MPEKASALIEDALSEISVRAAEVPLTSDEMSTGIRYINRMFTALEVNGVSLGFTKITSPSDEVTIPDGVVEGAVPMLAVRLAKQFQMPVSADLFTRAQNGFRTMVKLTVRVGPSEFPANLPIGSGNEWSGSWNPRFYADLEAQILGETNGVIALEDGTE
jgi:hypothetical protein